LVASEVHVGGFSCDREGPAGQVAQASGAFSVEGAPLRPG